MSECLFQRYRAHVLTAICHLFPDISEETLARVELTPPRDPVHGDMATNAALVLSKTVQR